MLGGFPARANLYKPFRIARFANFDRSVDVDFDELVSADKVARHPPFAAKWRDEAYQNDKTSVDHELCYFGDAAECFPARSSSVEAQIAVGPIADIVAVKNDGVATETVQRFAQPDRRSLIYLRPTSR